MFKYRKHPPTTATKILESIPFVMRHIAMEMRQRGSTMHHTHFRLLGMLSHHAWTLSELAESHSVSAPTMSNTITTLEERGWVTRVRSQEDRRVVLIETTDEGRRIIQESFERAEAYIDSILSDLDPADLDALDRGMDVLKTVFEQAASADCEHHNHT